MSTAGRTRPHTAADEPQIDRSCVLWSRPAMCRVDRRRALGGDVAEFDAGTAYSLHSSMTVGAGQGLKADMDKYEIVVPSTWGRMSKPLGTKAHI